MSSARYYSTTELAEIGFARVGRNVKLDRSTIVVNAERISLGDNCRIDAFCLITASAKSVSIGSHVHIAAGVYIFGGGGVEIADFVGLSSRVAVYSTNDDYSGEVLTGPTIPEDLVNVTSAKVVIGRHVVVGAGSIVLPGVTINEGSAVGALSLVKSDVAAFTLVGGNPLRYIKPRSRRLIELEAELWRREAACD